MNQAEASSSDDDMCDEDHAMDELAAAVLKDELAQDASLQQAVLEAEPPAAAQREQDIMAEVARRRAALDADATRRKSDEIFDHFDQDRDGYLGYKELRALGQATGGELPKAAYVSICSEIGADPKKGVTKALLLCMYTDAALVRWSRFGRVRVGRQPNVIDACSQGDAHRDYNLVFKR